VAFWVKLVRDERRGAAPAPTPRPQPRRDAVDGAPIRLAPARSVERAQPSAAADDDTGDPELAAYNRYLGWLNANPRRSPSEYPG
jgi:hypothetical protein